MRFPLLAFGLLMVPTRALAAQFVVTDVTYEHSATTTTDSHNRVLPSAETPKNWKAPIDYATAGSVHVRLEVFTKPSAENTRFQICFEATPSYACTDQSPTYTKTGVYDWDTSFPKFYQYSMVDWTKGVLKVALILKDDMNMKPAPENVGEARSKLFMPSKVRVTVTVVAPGSTYVPPSADAGADAAPDAPLDAAAEAAVDSAVIEPDATPIVDTGVVVVDEGVDSEPVAAAPPVEDDSGCSTGSRHTHSPLAPLLGLALAVVVSTRRRR